MASLNERREIIWDELERQLDSRIFVQVRDWVWDRVSGVLVITTPLSNIRDQVREELRLKTDKDS